MKNSNQQIAKDLAREITDSNMSFRKKLLVLQMLDKAFRKHLGIMFLSNSELEENDILFRSM